MTLALALTRSSGSVPLVARRRVSGAGVAGPLGVGLAPYASRARKVALGALVVGGAALVTGALVHPAWWALAAPALLGAAFDLARARLGATVALDGEHLRVTRGAHAGLVLARGDVQEVGFGAPARPGHRAPETFWRGDFESEGHSHLVVVRLVPRAGRPRRLVLPERSVREARLSVAALDAWRSAAATTGPR